MLGVYGENIDENFDGNTRFNDQERRRMYCEFLYQNEMKNGAKQIRIVQVPS